MGTYDEIAELPLEIESYELEGLQHDTGDFERLTTVVRLRGRGTEGIGEDVVYDALDHVALQDAGATETLQRFRGIRLLPVLRDIERDPDVFANRLRHPAKASLRIAQEDCRPLSERHAPIMPKLA